MDIVYFSNFIDHHMAPVCDELYKLTNGSFRYVEVVPMPDAFRKGGYPDFSDKPYLIRYWKDEESRNIGEKLLLDAEVVVFNSCLVLDFEKKRAKAGLFSFEMAERWLKRGWINVVSPRLLENMWNYYTIFHSKPFYKLCAGGYVASDQRKMFSYKNRCFKWGYFTTIDKTIEDEIVKLRSDKHTIRIMWCARYLKLKHPEMPIKLAAYLKSKGYNFVLDMYGSGDELENTKNLCRNLGVEDVVEFHGNVPNKEILITMRKHDIFLFTSDREEGWGAVVNESMSNGCVVVASNVIGAVPYLINDGENGLIFESENQTSLNNKVESLFRDSSLIKKMSLEAYHTMRDVWSPENAAKNLIQLIADLKTKKQSSIKDGPCSLDTGYNRSR